MLLGIVGSRCTAQRPEPAGSASHGLSLPVGLTIAIAVMLVNYPGAVWVALRRAGPGRQVEYSVTYVRPEGREW